MESTERDGEYTPAGENTGVNTTFTVDEIARAFGVEAERVHQAIDGEFRQSGGSVDSRQAQHLAEVLLGDQPQDQQLAALMKLGAYTPRPDHDTGLGEKDPTEESDRLVRSAGEDDGERG
jgi:hypothetical protein